FTLSITILSGAMNVLILQCCVFFFLCTRESVEIMLQFQTLEVVSDKKMNLVGALSRSFFEFLNTPGKTKKKKIKGKREFLHKTSFRLNRFFIWFKYLKFSSNVYVSVIYIQLNFQKCLAFFELFITTEIF
ncbi:hypothetical protein FWK35_00019591, partial [Aphis craccivora]